MTWKECVPPILLTVLRTLPHKPRVKPVYASYAEAFAACAGGYEDRQLIRTVYEKTRRYRVGWPRKNPRSSISARCAPSWA